jgi:hypothetical protein
VHSTPSPPQGLQSALEPLYLALKGETGVPLPPLQLDKGPYVDPEQSQAGEPSHPSPYRPRELCRILPRRALGERAGETARPPGNTGEAKGQRPQPPQVTRQRLPGPFNAAVQPLYAPQRSGATQILVRLSSSGQENSQGGALRISGDWRNQNLSHRLSLQGPGRVPHGF